MTEIRRLRADLDGYAKRLDALERATPEPDPRLPSVQVYAAGPDGFRHAIMAGGREKRIIRMNDRVSLRIYRTVAGGVAKVTVAPVDGEEDMGVARLKDLEIRTIDGDRYSYAGKFCVVPGGCLAKTFYTGNPLDYWSARAPQDVVPEWAPAKLAEPRIYHKMGPYNPCWGERGDAKGGQGIDPIFMNWRKCPDGWVRLAEELDGTAQRNANWYTDDVGSPQWRSNVMMAGTNGHNIPDGYSFSTDDAARWWPGARDLVAFTKGDAQHFRRHYRAALELRHLDPFAADVCAMMLNHVKLWMLGDPARDGIPSYFYTVRQMIQHLEENPGPHEYMGREFAWAADLAWELEPDSQFSADLETCVRLSAGPRTGISFTNSMSYYAGFAREPQGGPFGEDEAILQTREANFLEYACRKRRGLHGICRKVRAFLGTRPPMVMNLDGAGFGDSASDWPLFLGDMLDEDPQHWMDVGSHRNIDEKGHGAQPMDFLPPELWSPLV